MPSLHQSRSLPWSVIVEFHRRRRSPDRYPTSSGKFLDDNGPQSKLTARVEHFAVQLEKAIDEFAKTESAKHDRKKVDAIKRLYPDSMVDDVLLDRYQSPAAWNEWIGRHRKELMGHTSEGGELCDVIKELFNRDMMPPLLHLARNVPMMDRLSFITYSNFFHYGHRRVLQDALTCYLLVNYLVATGDILHPGRLPDTLDRFKSQEDHNASLTVYNRLIGDYTKDGIPDKKVKELQRFSFRCLYQYQLFWNEVCDRSGAERIDWKDEVRLCLGSML